MDFIKKITQIYQKEENDSIEHFSHAQKVVSLYSLYHYYNDDVTKLEDIDIALCEVNKNYCSLNAVFMNCTMDFDAVDFLFYLDIADFFDVYNNGFDNYLKNCARIVGDIIYKNITDDNADAIESYNLVAEKVDVNSFFVIKILVDGTLDLEKKFEIQQKVAEFVIKANNFSFEIIFADDIEDEINDVESPKECVSKGFLKLYNQTSGVCYFGEEHSFLTTISAKSLKMNYLQFGTHGLLASNLRFFVVSKKIDPKIIETIRDDKDNFCYYNNGIIVTCDDYKISDDLIELRNFSIVNGGQTTNLIGRTPFDNDFPVVCKVIKNKYVELGKRVDFLSKVAEASNTQKPINAKDLIANKKEQRLLKLQFAEAGMFLKVKRGEKIDLSQYREKWQNASNDEVAQLIYSSVYQMPGSAKNSKSRLLETEKIYNLIFKNSYCNNFFISLQRIKIAFNDYQKYLKKTEAKSSVKFALSKHTNFFILAVISAFYKVFTNDELYNYVKQLSLVDVNNNNEILKRYLSQNDIGNLNFINNKLYHIITKESFNVIFNRMTEDVLIPAYQKFKTNYYSYAYANFCKSDMYYYNFVLPEIVKKIKSEFVNYRSLFEPFFDLNNKAINNIVEINEFSVENNNLTLQEELIALRKKIWKESNGTIEAYEVFTNKQLANIMKVLPKTTIELMTKAYLKKAQVEKYGNQIVELILKYTSVNNLL